MDLFAVDPAGRPEIAVEIERSSQRKKSYQKHRLSSGHPILVYAGSKRLNRVLDDLDAEEGSVNLIRIPELSNRATLVRARVRWNAFGE